MINYELDSVYVKFKTLLANEQDATLTLKSEAGRACVTLCLDLGHVHSGQDQQPGGPRNGPARQRRREKRAAARLANDEQSAEGSKITAAVEASKDINATAEASKVKDSVAEESNEVPHKKTAAEKDSVVKLTAAEEANDNPTKEIAAKVVVRERKETNAAIAEAVSITEVEDMLCPDEEYKNKLKKTRSVGCQTLESGIAFRTTSKFNRDYYTLRHDDSD